MHLIKIILSIIPVPFFFHFYEYNSHLDRQDADLLLPVFLLLIVVAGITSRDFKFPVFFGVNFIMIVLSLLFGSFSIADNGSWFTPFGRDFAIIFISVIYIFGQLVIRGISKIVLIKS